MTHRLIFTIVWLVAICSSPYSFSGEKKVISTNKAPGSIGPFSQALQVGNMLYVSGQVGIDPQTGKMVPGGIEAQTHQVLKNIEVVLKEAGYSLDDVVQSHVYLSDLENYSAMNVIYSGYFRKQPPARATVEVSRIPLDALIEIMVTAAK